MLEAGQDGGGALGRLRLQAGGSNREPKTVSRGETVLGGMRVVDHLPVPVQDGVETLPRARAVNEMSPGLTGGNRDEGKIEGVPQPGLRVRQPGVGGVVDEVGNLIPRQT